MPKKQKSISKPKPKPEFKAKAISKMNATKSSKYSRAEWKKMRQKHINHVLKSGRELKWYDF